MERKTSKSQDDMKDIYLHGLYYDGNYNTARKMRPLSCGPAGMQVFELGEFFTDN